MTPYRLNAFSFSTCAVIFSRMSEFLNCLFNAAQDLVQGGRGICPTDMYFLARDNVREASTVTYPHYRLEFFIRRIRA
jgi:hypothetical protein